MRRRGSDSSWIFRLRSAPFQAAFEAAARLLPAVRGAAATVPAVLLLAVFGTAANGAVLLPTVLGDAETASATAIAGESVTSATHLLAVMPAAPGTAVEPGAAGSRAPAAVSSAAGPAFDAERAFSYIETQCEFGPRAPGSRGHRLAREYLVRFLSGKGAKTFEQSFAVSMGDSSVDLTNIVARFYPSARPRVALCAHWDTRPWADLDPDSTRRMEPILGANDGASGVAVLLEVANALGLKQPMYGVDLVFFDAEDMGSRDGLEYALGAKHFAERTADLPDVAILVDMVADGDLDFPIEGYSRQLAPALAGVVWRTASRLGLSEFRSEVGEYVFDDHVRLLEAGVPAVAIIDIDYPYWHTLADRPDKCSPAGLDSVGTVLLHLLYSPEGLLGPVRR